MKPNHGLLLNGKNHALLRRSFYFTSIFKIFQNFAGILEFQNRSYRRQQISNNNFYQSEMFQQDTSPQMLVCTNQYHVHAVVYFEFLIRKCIAS